VVAAVLERDADPAAGSLVVGHEHFCWARSQIRFGDTTASPPHHRAETTSPVRTPRTFNPWHTLEAASSLSAGVLWAILVPHQ
jgi:hypothetical protein